MNRKASAVVGLGALTYMTVAAVRHLRDFDAASLIGLVDFGIHEFGHLCFALFGEWMGFAGGSLMQVLIPALTALLFYRQGEKAAVAVCGGWMAVALARMAFYIADARALELDLVSFSPDGGDHDWNYLLRTTGLLAWDTRIAGAVRLAAWLLLPLSVLYALYAAQAAFRPETAATAAAMPPSRGSRRRSPRP